MLRIDSEGGGWPGVTGYEMKEVASARDACFCNEHHGCVESMARGAVRAARRATIPCRGCRLTAGDKTGVVALLPQES